MTRTFLLLGALCGVLNAAQSADEPGPPATAEVYYSKDDPNWPAAAKALDEAEKNHPRLKLTRVSIDTPEGYKQLAAAETRLPIDRPGEITFVFGHFYLTDKGQRHEIATHVDHLVARVFSPDSGKGRLAADPVAYAQKLFGAGIKLAPLEEAKINPATADAQEPAYRYFLVQREGKDVGVVVDAYHPILCPICNDSQFLIAVKIPEVELVALEPVRLIEKYGTPLEDQESAAYLKRFVGKKPGSKPVEVDGIAAATKTSNSYVIVVNEVLAKLAQRFKPAPPAEK